ncbi:MAG: TonB-dependent receptor, partial [Chitinophagaceae bacterium]
PHWPQCTSSFRAPEESHSWFSYKHGSFGFINPAAGFTTSISKRAPLSLNGGFQKANGQYDFNAYDGSGKTGRKNGDIKQWRVEADLPVLFADSSTLKTKLYYYQSERGLPGSVLLYNESANERLYNTHLFAQLNWQKNISQRWHLLFGAKSMLDRQKYLDPDFLNNEGFLENDFYQTENYFTAALRYDISPNFRASIAGDYFVNKLKRHDIFDAQFEEPVRRNFLNSISLTYTHKHFNAETNVLYSKIRNTTSGNKPPEEFDKFTPAFSFSVQPASKIPLRIRALYKHIFRAPSLDDMYFTFVGNSELKPEYSTQFGTGLTWQSFHPNKIFSRLLFTADGYIIHVKDKILALPRNNLFQWSMMNIGKAETRSLDLAMETDVQAKKNLIFRTNFTYSYQSARDVTSPSSPAYKNQLAYIPQHSGSARISSEIKHFTVSWNLLFSSHRYRTGDRVNENLVEGYALHDLNLKYAFPSRSGWTYNISAELNNLFNRRYEVVKYFPMPGFNWRISLMIYHKKN